MKRENRNQIHKSLKVIFKKRKACIMKKTMELATLCRINASIICFGPDGKEVKMWPENPSDVKTLINMYRHRARRHRQPPQESGSTTTTATATGPSLVGGSDRVVTAVAITYDAIVAFHVATIASIVHRHCSTGNQATNLMLLQPLFTTGDVTMLLTGPRQRTAEELDQSKVGGRFRSYGYDRNRNDDESLNSR